MRIYKSAPYTLRRSTTTTLKKIAIAVPALVFLAGGVLAYQNILTSPLVVKADAINSTDFVITVKTDKILALINNQVYTATNNGDSTWTLSADVIGPLEPGEYNILVTVTDQAGNITTTNTSLTVVVAPKSASGLAETGVGAWAPAVVSIGALVAGLVIAHRRIVR